MIDKVGAEQVRIWRRSFDTPPPPLPEDSPYFVGNDRRYSGVDVPASESLKDTIERVLPYYEREIAPRLMQGQRIIVAAHGNSLRALVMVLEKLDPEGILKRELATGVPIIYRLNADATVANKVDLAA
jgi:2,3-bisphosphoglycerate-dependent phosphoglycerate mutase